MTNDYHVMANYSNPKKQTNKPADQGMLSPIDHIQFDVTIQIPVPQHGASERVGVRACAIEIKPGKLHASLIYAFRIALTL